MKDNEELEEWVARALAGDYSANKLGVFANDMWAVCGRASSLEPMRPLFSSNDANVLEIISFLAFELHQEMRPFFQEIIEIINKTECADFRFSLYEAIAHSATYEDGWVVACLFDGLRDSEQAVRWKVMQLLTYLDDRAMVAGLKYLNSTRQGWTERGWRSALAGAGSGKTTNLKKLLASDKQEDRLFATAICLRPRHVIAQSLADLAAGAADEETIDFVKRQTDRLTQM